MSLACPYEGVTWSLAVPQPRRASMNLRLRVTTKFVMMCPSNVTCFNSHRNVRRGTTFLSENVFIFNVGTDSGNVTLLGLIVWVCVDNMLGCHWEHTPWDCGVDFGLFLSRSGNKLLLSGGRCRVGVTHPKGIIIKRLWTGYFQN